MAEKVYLVWDGYDDHAGVNILHNKELVEVCDTFESACNRVRTCLSAMVDNEENIFKTYPLFAKNYMTFECYWTNRGYTFDPYSLLTNDTLATKYVYSRCCNYGGCDCWFEIEEREIKHYD